MGLGPHPCHSSERDTTCPCLEDIGGGGGGSGKGAVHKGGSEVMKGWRSANPRYQLNPRI